MEGNFVTKTTDLSGGRYIVWSPESAKPPQVVYNDRPAAIRVALGMSKKYPGTRFCVCKLMGVSQVTEAKYSNLTDE